MRGWLKRWRWALAVLAMLAAGLAYAFWPEAVPVDTSTVTRGPMAVGITDDGVTRAEDYYVVSAPVTGYLSRIELETGDLVSAGEIITRMTGRPATPLDPRSERELRSALVSAQAAANSAQASLGQARSDLARAEALAKRGFLPKAQLEAARTRVSVGEAAVAQGLAEAARVRSMLSLPAGSARNPVIVRAPVSGSILAVVTESEGVIAEGTPLLTIGDPGQIEIVADFLSREAVRVKPGDAVRITDWGGAEPLAGRVERIEPYGRLKISALGIEEQRVNVIIALTGKSRARAARLGHGFQVDATIVLWSKPDALRIPIGALFRGSDGGWRVFAIEDGRARERTVELGHINEDFAELLRGLHAGDAVIVNPANALQNGDRVRMRRGRPFEA